MAPEGFEILIPGHNDLDADRINLVFAPWGWEGTDGFRQVVLMYLGWDGSAQFYDDTGWPAEAADAVGADLGMFGWEPLRSNRDRFNVWLTDASPESPVGWLNGLEPEPISLPNMTVAIMALDPERVLPSANSIAGQQVEIFWPDPQRLSDDPFDNSMISISSSYPVGAMRALPHEIGHAVFNLPDEYVGRAAGFDGNERNSFYPSCPADQETALAWWGDRLGEEDPTVDVWVDAMTEAGFAPDPGLVDVVRAGAVLQLVEGGCFEVPGSYRMANDTLMGFAAPTFGVANADAIQQVLDLFDG